MTNRIKTADAKIKFNELMAEQAKASAGSNTLVSKAESTTLDPHLKKAEEAIRAEGGKGTRVTVDALAERASSDAMKVWDEFNPPNNGQDSTWMSKAEAKEIRDADPALGALTDIAMLRAGKRGTDPTAVVRDFMTSFDFETRRATQGTLPQGQRVDAREGQPLRASLPSAVVDAFDFYHRLEAADIGGVSLHQGKIGGHDVFAIFVGTDGDEGFFEAMSATGEPLASGRLMGDVLATLDAVPGRSRLAPMFTTLGGFENQEGYSEPAERALFGQVPIDWPGDVVIDGGTLNHANGLATTLALAPGTTLSKTENDVAIAAFDFLWDRHLKHTVNGNDPIELGSMRQGQLKVGAYQHPINGESYMVADWKDVDDGSFTLYFKMTDLGPKLGIGQFNN